MKSYSRNGACVCGHEGGKEGETLCVCVCVCGGGGGGGGGDQLHRLPQHILSEE